MNLALQAVLHVATQSRVDRQFRRLWPLGDQFRLPLRDRNRYSSRPPRVAALRVSSRETVDGLRPIRRAISRTPTPWTESSPISSRSAKRQVPPGYRARHEKCHASTMTEPARAYWLRYANGLCCLLARDAGRNLLPKAPLNLMPMCRRTRRAHRSAPRQLIHPSRRSSHETPPRSKVLRRPVEFAGPSSHWYRDGTGDALLQTAAAALSSDARALSQNVCARQALVEISAALAAKNNLTALALQERIKRLR